MLQPPELLPLPVLDRLVRRRQGAVRAVDARRLPVGPGLVLEVLAPSAHAVRAHPGDQHRVYRRGGITPVVAHLDDAALELRIDDSIRWGCVSHLSKSRIPWRAHGPQWNPTQALYVFQDSTVGRPWHRH